MDDAAARAYHRPAPPRPFWRRIMLLPLAIALLAGAAPPPPAAQQRPDQGQAIVITGKSLKDTERALAE